MHADLLKWSQSCLGLLAMVQRVAKRRDAAGQALVTEHA